jgi:hypothetical protein
MIFLNYIVLITVIKPDALASYYELVDITRFMIAFGLCKQVSNNMPDLMILPMDPKRLILHLSNILITWGIRNSFPNI